MKTENSTRFGFAQTVITPDAQAVYLDGFGERITPAEGVRDPLYVKAFVICAGSFRYALAVFDACGFEKRIALGLKRSIARRNGLTPDCVTVCATHTHSAPASGVLGDLPINYYLWDQIGMCAALTVQEAFQTASPCSPVFLRGDELSLMGNRRGRELCDRRIKICGFYDTENSLKGALVLASCHATCSSGMLLSADYPSVLTQAAQEKYPGVPFLFLQGRGADADPLLPDELGDDERIAALGGELADKVLSALENFENDGCVSACAPQLASVTVKIPMLPYPPKAVLQKTIDFFEEKRGSAEDSFESRRIVREIYWHQKALCETLEWEETPRENSLLAELQLLRLSDRAAFLFLPFEIFCETGNRLEAICGIHGLETDSVFIVGHANGTNGYLAPASEFKMDDALLSDMEYWYGKTICAKEAGTKEILSGHYEIINAPHWYNLPQCSRTSEMAVIRGVEMLFEKLSMQK